MKLSTYLASFFVFLLVSSNAIAKNEALSVSVSVKPLSELLISPSLSAPANIVSLNHSVISAEITGRALSVKVEIGDIVKKGSRLVSLDCRSYSLAKKQANASLNVAKTQFNYAKKQLVRNQNLVRKGIIPREAFEKAEAGQLSSLADIELQKVSIETANLAISRCYIKAPFTGQITQRMVQKGQLVTAGTPLFRLMQTKSLELKAKLPPSQVAKLNKSSSLTFIMGDTKIKAVVRSIIQIVDEATRTQEVRFSLPKGSNLAMGSSGRIEWNDNERQLPAEFILRRNSQLGVMLAHDIKEGVGNAKFHPLPNAQEGQPAAIQLLSNSAVITLNRFRVKDGDVIKVVNEK
ncbi:MAG: efflux RND transporter periplasmic adaptor subunit [Cocleimonas sp.]